MKKSILILLTCIAFTSCNRTIIGTDGQAYYKVAKRDYVQAQAIDSLQFTIQHYRVVGR